jgi:hypothetical protein
MKHHLHDSALAWIRSYLTNRTQRIAIGSVFSNDMHLKYGEPQGSVLGPRLYCLCQFTCLEVQLQDTPGYHLYSSGNPYHAVNIFHRSVSKTDNKVWGLTRILVAHRILGAYH